MKTAILIPARMGSTRLPGKPLLNATGKPLIQHTYEKAQKVGGVDFIAVATDDEIIAATVRGFGGIAIMTDKEHKTGSERIAQAAKAIPFDASCIINLQGDEPEINPTDVEALIKAHYQSGAFVTTMATKFPSHKNNSINPDDPSTVKVVLSKNNLNGAQESKDFIYKALYFSRAKIPFQQSQQQNTSLDYFLHIGIYAYSATSLKRFIAAPQSLLEQTEQLEQLRILEMGLDIAVLKVPFAYPGIDTPLDYQEFTKRVKANNNI